MSKITMNPYPYLPKKHALALVLFLYTLLSHAQLTVNVAVTNETCPGTGALSLSVSGASSSSPVTYKVYFLPEDTIPVWNSTTSYVPALQDGDYLIVATQESGDTTISGQANATISSLYVPVQFYVDNTASACSNSTDLTVTVTAGTASAYEIINGPVTAPAQSSNVFQNLPSGSYEIRVTDTCGNGFTNTYSFTTQPSVLALQEPQFPDVFFPSCNKINVSYSVTLQSGISIVYPLSAQITVTPPGGGPATTYNRNITNGDPSSVLINQMIDYYTADYTVAITVTDPCGNTYTGSSVVSKPMRVNISPLTGQCGVRMIKVSASTLVPPFTMQLTGPAGFDAASYNAQYPGPYSGDVVFGTDSNPVPLGSYTVTITDSCGNSLTRTENVGQAPPADFTPITENNNCSSQLGRITIKNTNYPLQSASVVSAPAAFTEALPYNATGDINDGRLRISNLPQGTYTLNLTDTCGNSYTGIVAEVPAFSPEEPTYETAPDCTPGKGTVTITGSVSAVTITAAPADFAAPLPYNASADILDGTFSKDNLPPGEYSFAIDTNCQAGYTHTMTVDALTVTADNVSVQQTCNDFYIVTSYNSNAGDAVTFWLQKRDGNTANWMHPATGIVYTEGQPLDSTTSVALAANQTTTGLTYNGEFRILRQQQSTAAGATGSNTKNCITLVQEFEYYNQLAITGIYNRTCVGENYDVQINATGVGLHYELISHNGDTSFYVDNGQDNVFNALVSGLYIVKVSDSCGEFRTEQFNVAELPPLISASIADDIYYCDDSGTGTGTFDLTQQDDGVLGDVDPDIATVTYHLSQQDADAGANPLPLNYTSGSATIYARVEWNINALCYGTSSFNLVVASPFALQMADEWPMCNGEAITITADPGYELYEWSTGETTPQITVTEAGAYTVTVTNTATCEVAKTVNAVVVNRPTIANIDVQDWTQSSNSISVITDQPDTSAFEYSLDGINYQDEPVFANMAAGMYTVYVRDRFGCNAPDQKDVLLAMYPTFFTPNGDGNNDTWRIEFAVLDPGLTVQVYDRYGRFIYNFGSTSTGWDGTFQGQPLPADDYWFIIKRGNGKEYRGHFSIIR